MIDGFDSTIEVIADVFDKANFEAEVEVGNFPGGCGGASWRHTSSVEVLFIIDDGEVDMMLI